MDRVPGECSEKSMTSPETYLLRVRELLSSVSNILTVEEMREICYLVDHDEPAEALRSLAWIVVDGGKRVPASVIGAIRELTLNLIDKSDLPDDLDAHAVD